MGVQFLSEGHMAEATTALQADDDFISSIANINMGLQFQVTEGPAGDVDYYLSVGDGVATMALGELDSADVSISSTYETAEAMFKGELNTQMAFMTGKIKVAGNMAVLMMNQAVINAWGSAMEGLEIDY
ncbi:MAG: SCP2 sterol-binding domain-containing protein [Acidimicrobiia bacterium]|nr:SCP2 sterol-binding domain-containing protein [Acidimicrobiia bacterium]